MAQPASAAPPSPPHLPRQRLRPAHPPTKRSTASVKLGDPGEHNTLVGPLIDERAFNAMQESPRRQPALWTTITGGDRVLSKEIPSLFYFRPGPRRSPPRPIPSNTKPSPPSIHPQYPTSPTPRLHNDVPQGLSASIFTMNLRRKPSSSSPPPAFRLRHRPTSTIGNLSAEIVGASVVEKKPEEAANPAPTPGSNTCAAPPTPSTTAPTYPLAHGVKLRHHLSCRCNFLLSRGALTFLFVIPQRSGGICFWAVACSFPSTKNSSSRPSSHILTSEQRVERYPPPPFSLYAPLPPPTFPSSQPPIHIRQAHKRPPTAIDRAFFFRNSTDLPYPAYPSSVWCPVQVVRPHRRGSAPELLPTTTPHIRPTNRPSKPYRPNRPQQRTTISCNATTGLLHIVRHSIASGRSAGTPFDPPQ